MLPRIAILRGNSCVREYGLPYASVISVARAVLEPVSSSTRAVRYGCVVPTEQTGLTRVANRTIFSRYCRALRSLCGLYAVYREFRAARSRWTWADTKTAVRRARRARMPRTSRATWSRATRNRREPRGPTPRGRSRGWTIPLRCDARWRRRCPRANRLWRATRQPGRAPAHGARRRTAAA